MNDKCLNKLGICRKAGKLIAGTEKVKETIKSNKAFLVFAADDISEKSVKEINFLIKKSNNDYLLKSCLLKKEVLILNYKKQEISHATGTLAGIFAITEKNFALEIIKYKER